MSDFAYLTREELETVQGVLSAVDEEWGLTADEKELQRRVEEFLAPAIPRALYEWERKPGETRREYKLRTGRNP
jgi:hypothetical protein